MDIETLLGLIAVIAMLLIQALSSKKKAQQKRQSQSSSSPSAALKPPRKPGGLEEALREIQRALDPSPPTQEPAPPVPPRSREFSSFSFSESSADAFKFKAHDTSYKKEEVFESFHGTEKPKAQHSRRREPIKQKKAVSVAAYRTETEMKGIVPTRRNALLKQLRDPQSARSAIVLSEILGPPKSKRLKKK